MEHKAIGVSGNEKTLNEAWIPHNKWGRSLTRWPGHRGSPQDDLKLNSLDISPQQSPTDPTRESTPGITSHESKTPSKPKSTSNTKPTIQPKHSPNLDLSTTQHPPLSPTHQIPQDTGLQPWLQVLAAHLLQINTWGTANSFGIFESHYTTSIPPLASKSAVSWIGSLQLFLIFLIGTLSGRAVDAGYTRPVLLCGAVLQLSGVFLASLGRRYWQIVLTQGVLEGLGNGCVFCCIITLVSTFFQRRRALALGLVTSGASTGGIILPLVARSLLGRVGVAWTLRVFGFIMLANWCLAMALIRSRVAPRRLGPLVEWSAFKDRAYAWFCIGGFSNLLAAYFAYYYISTFATDVIGVSASTSFLLILIMNGVGIVGRTLPSLVADKYIGPFNTYIPITLSGAILFYSWTAIHDRTGLYVFAVVYGIVGAGIQGFFLTCCASLTSDLQKMGTRNGMAFTIVSISSLTGPPIAGRLVEVDGGNYLYAQVFGGSALMAGAIALIMARAARTGWVLRKRM